MINLSSLTRYVPEKYLAPSELYQFTLQLNNISTELLKQSLSEEVKNKLNGVTEVTNAIVNLFDGSSADEISQKSLLLIDSALSLFPTEKQKDIKNSNGYKNTIKQINNWQVVSTAIGEQTENINESIAFTKDYESELDPFSVGIKVGAKGAFSLNVLNNEEENNAGLLVPEASCLVNQVIAASYTFGATISGMINIVELTGAFEKSGAVTFNTYFQVDKTTPTYKALLAMYKNPVQPWHLDNVQKVMQTNGYVGTGYKAFSIKTNSSFMLSGKIAIGKSLTTQTSAQGKVIDIDASAEVSISRQQTISGEVTLLVGKQENNKIAITISLQESNKNSSAFNLALQARIKGMDKLASQYVDILLGKGDKLIAFLEKYSNVGQLVVTKLSNTVDDDEWYKPIATLVLGQTSVDSVVKTLIDDELKTLINTSRLTTDIDAEIIADNIIKKLFDVFGSKPPEQDFLVDELNKVKAVLVTEINELQTSLKKAAQKFSGMIQNQTQQQLQPIAVLGESIAENIEDFDDEIEKNFNIVISKYQSFKEKITKQLEKAANIKLGLSYQSAIEKEHSKQQKMTLVLEDVSNENVQQFYRYLTVGDGKKASLLLAALEAENLVTVSEKSQGFTTIISSISSLGMHIIGYDIASIKDITTELQVNVDTNGNLFVKHEYKVKASASGLSEKREATLNITYGIAQATLNKSFQGAFGLEYTNQDDRLHTKSEIEDFFSSLDLNNNPHAKELKKRLTTPMPTLISKERIAKAIHQYQVLYAESTYTSSKISMVMKADKIVYQKLLAMDENKLFNRALLYLVYLSNSKNKKENMITILNLYPVIDSRYSNLKVLFDHLFENDNYVNINMSDVRDELETITGGVSFLNSIPEDNAAYNKHKKLIHTINKMEKLAITARSLSRLPSTLKEVANVVDKFSNTTNQDDALETLNKELKALNRTVEDQLDNWIDVNGVFKNGFEDFLSKWGWAKAGINTRLLIFFILLQDAIDLDEPLFLTTITLSNGTDDPRVIMV